MKLLSCHIDNFGILQNYDHDFEDGLNIILHDNGWGKTTFAVFLKVMLYGITTKNSKNITENERKRYLPWQGGVYGGTLDFEAGGKTYRITRQFGAQARMDKVKIVELETGRPAKFETENIGEELFHLDANAFQRSIFINHNSPEMETAMLSIHSRLNAIVSNVNDLEMYDEAITELTEKTKEYEKRGQKGKIYDIERAINTLKDELSELKDEIDKQDEARHRIVEIDRIIGDTEKDIAAKKAEYEKTSGARQKIEAYKKQLDEVEKSLADITLQLSESQQILGNNIPDSEETDNIKYKITQMEKDSAKIKVIAEELKNLNDRYREYTEFYEGSIPDVSDIAEIRRIYGELQGILSVKDEETVEEIPNEYETIDRVVNAYPDYVNKLGRAAELKKETDRLVRL